MYDESLFITSVTFLPSFKILLPTPFPSRQSQSPLPSFPGFPHFITLFGICGSSPSHQALMIRVILIIHHIDTFCKIWRMLWQISISQWYIGDHSGREFESYSNHQVFSKLIYIVYYNFTLQFIDPKTI